MMMNETQPQQPQAGEPKEIPSYQPATAADKPASKTRKTVRTLADYEVPTLRIGFYLVAGAILVMTVIAAVGTKFTTMSSY